MSNANTSHPLRVVSGMRPTGKLHLGQYHGVIKNWVDMQVNYECFFFIADWHALTTHYETPDNIVSNSEEMLIDWLAAGINPTSTTLFVQSQVPEHAELHLLLSMITPLSWLERVPTYKDQQEKLRERDLATYGFLGYPLLQAADILIYRANLVPVGEDQVVHVELTREVARRFNRLYGKDANFEQHSEEAIKKMGKKNSKRYRNLRKTYQEQGDVQAVEAARALLESEQNLSMSDRERLFGYIEGSGKIILTEPEAKLTKASKMPGLDGLKMSKSYGNTITLREDPNEIDRKIRTMPTDTNRVRRNDPGDPTKCPVWQLHKVYSNNTIKQWVQEGCTTAGIGCIDCKAPIIEAIQKELKPIRERANDLENDRKMLHNILKEGREVAADIASETMKDIREAMKLLSAN